MEKNTIEQQNAPLGVATNVPLHFTCVTCTHFSNAFEIPYCCIFECEIPNIKKICEYFELFTPTEDLPF